MNQSPEAHNRNEDCDYIDEAFNNKAGTALGYQT